MLGAGSISSMLICNFLFLRAFSSFRATWHIISCLMLAVTEDTDLIFVTPSSLPLSFAKSTRPFFPPHIKLDFPVFYSPLLPSMSGFCLNVFPSLRLCTRAAFSSAFCRVPPISILFLLADFPLFFRFRLRLLFLGWPARRMKFMIRDSRMRAMVHHEPITPVSSCLCGLAPTAAPRGHLFWVKGPANRQSGYGNTPLIDHVREEKSTKFRASAFIHVVFRPIPARQQQITSRGEPSVLPPASATAVVGGIGAGTMYIPSPFLLLSHHAAFLFLTMRCSVAFPVGKQFIYRVSSLWLELGVSSVIVVGGCGDYFDVHNTAILVDNYTVSDATERAHSVSDS